MSIFNIICYIILLFFIVYHTYNIIKSNIKKVKRRKKFFNEVTPMLLYQIKNKELENQLKERLRLENELLNKNN